MDRPKRHDRLKNRRTRRLLLAPLFCALAVSTAARADEHDRSAEAEEIVEAGTLAEEAEPVAPPIVRAAERLMAQQLAVAAEIDDLNAQVEKATGEDRLVLEKQNINAKLEFLKLTGRLVDNLLEQEEEGLSTEGLRLHVSTQVIELTPAIVRHITDVEEDISELRREREDLDSSELLAFEQQLEREIDWLDSIYHGYRENVLHLEQLGLDYKGPREDLRNRIDQRAALEAGRIELVMQMLSELRERAGEDPDDPEVQAELTALDARLETVTSSLAKLVNHMEYLDLDATEYQQLLITTTGEVTSDIFRPEVAIGLLQEWVEGARGWLRENGPAVFFKTILFMMVVGIGWVGRNVTRRILNRALHSSNMHRSQLLTRMLIATASNAVLFVALLLGLSQLGLELGPLLAGLGIAGFIVGFALQDSLANFAAGMMILGYRPFDVGDLIEAAGVRGEVSHMSLVNTTILTIDNRTLIVPNNKIWGDVITNITNQERRRVDMKFAVSSANDLEHTEQVLRDILVSDERILEDPEPMVKLHDLSDGQMTFVVRPWALTTDYWDVYWDVTREVKRRFDAEGIRIPYPQREFHLFQDKADSNEA